MNKVILIGRLTRDPELRMAGGSAVVNFSLAVDSGFNQKSGEMNTEFIECSAWGRTADNLAKYCKKGSLISVVGRIKNNDYTAQDGTKRRRTDVVCEDLRFLGGKQKADEGGSFDYSKDTMPSDMPTVDLSEDPFKSFSEEITLSSDDLPF